MNHKTMLVTIAVLALGLVPVPAAQAQICINWVDFCDGLELDINGDAITGFWRNATGCDGDDVAVVGIIRRDAVPSPCGLAVGSVGVACDERFGCEVFGDEWYFVLNEAENNWDLGHVGEGDIPPVPGACWTPDIAYEILLGPCPFLPEGPGDSLFSTLQAGR